MSDNPAGWQADPTGRHEHRYWDGSQWTDHVSDGGVASTDAYAAAEAAGAPEPPAAPEPAAPDATTQTPGWGDPTTAQPVPPSDPTAAWPTPPPPPVPPVPPTASYPTGPAGPASSGGSKKGFLIGGGILAAVIVAVVAFLLLGGDDDKSDVETRLAAQIKEDSEGELTDSQADCVAGYIVDEVGEDELKDVDFSADEPPEDIADEVIAAMMGSLEECDIDLGDLGGGADGGDDGATDEGDDGGSGEEGTYGSDPELDALWDACEDGDWEACDDLYLESPSGSEYEDFGDTCGDRNEPSGYCVDVHGDGSDTTGGDIDFDADMEEMLADIYEESLGLNRDQAECLANKLASVVESGEMDETEAMTEFMDYLDECDISMDDISGN